MARKPPRGRHGDHSKTGADKTSGAAAKTGGSSDPIVDQRPAAKKASGRAAAAPIPPALAVAPPPGHAPSATPPSPPAVVMRPAPKTAPILQKASARRSASPAALLSTPSSEPLPVETADNVTEPLSDDADGAAQAVAGEGAEGPAAPVAGDAVPQAAETDVAGATAAAGDEAAPPPDQDRAGHPSSDDAAPAATAPGDSIAQPVENDGVEPSPAAGNAATSPSGAPAEIEPAFPSLSVQPGEPTMADEGVPTGAKIPPQFREMAEQNLQQAKKAYEQYVSTTERMLNTIEDATRQAWSGARDVNLRMLAFADANAKAGFDYAERFVKAKDAKEVASLQQDYLKTSTERLGQQMREINQLATQAARSAADAAKPKT